MLRSVEIKSASVDCSRDQDKIDIKIPVASVRDRGKQMGNSGTSSRIYTVDYEIKGDRRKMRVKKKKKENVPKVHVSGALRMLAQLPYHLQK